MNEKESTRNECLHCHSVFPQSNRKSKRYCSKLCASRARYTKEDSIAPLAFLGAINELVVCSNLLEKGYYVFRNVSAHGPCDMVILKDGKCHRVEVKTAKRLVNGSLQYGPLPKTRGHDILAAVVGREIIYLDELP